MQKPARLSLNAGRRTELFRNYLLKLMGGSWDEDAYLDALSQAIAALVAGIGLSNGRPSEGLAAPADLVEICQVEDLSLLYQQGLEVRPTPDLGSPRWIRNSTARREAGIYYTPVSLIEPIIEFTLGPKLPPDLALISVCDPACGSGEFLVQACNYIVRRTGRPAAEVVRSCLFGCDIDATALEIARLRMWLAAGCEIPRENLRCADSLTADWTVLFPKAIRNGGFDAVVGNPPFGGVVDGRVADSVKSQRSSRFAHLGGTADLSYYFAALAHELVHPDGRVGLVMPRAVLSAASAKRLRRPKGMRLKLLQSVGRHDAFQGAAVHVCLVGFERGIETSQGAEEIELTSPTMNVSASLIVDEAYRIAPQIVDCEIGAYPKLLTTGLIEPGASRWGVDICRFLKSKYKHPRVPVNALSPRRQELIGKPKVIVAGLSRRLEAILDPVGEYAGSVGTYSITHPRDDLIELARAVDYLHSEHVREQFLLELGPTALGGGNITVTKPFLKRVLAQGNF